MVLRKYFRNWNLAYNRAETEPKLKFIKIWDLVISGTSRA